MTVGAAVTVSDIERIGYSFRSVGSVFVIEGHGEVHILVWPKWWAWFWKRRMGYKVRDTLQGRTACGVLIFIGIGKLWP